MLKDLGQNVFSGDYCISSLTKKGKMNIITCFKSIATYLAGTLLKVSKKYPFFQKVTFFCSVHEWLFAQLDENNECCYLTQGLIYVTIPLKWQPCPSYNCIVTASGYYELNSPAKELLLNEVTSLGFSNIKSVDCPITDWQNTVM